MELRGGGFWLRDAVDEVVGVGLAGRRRVDGARAAEKSGAIEVNVGVDGDIGGSGVVGIGVGVGAVIAVGSTVVDGSSTGHGCVVMLLMMNAACRARGAQGLDQMKGSRLEVDIYQRDREDVESGGGSGLICSRVGGLRASTTRA